MTIAANKKGPSDYTRTVCPIARIEVIPLVVTDLAKLTPPLTS